MRHVFPLFVFFTEMVMRDRGWKQTQISSSELWNLKHKTVHAGGNITGPHSDQCYFYWISSLKAETSKRDFPIIKLCIKAVRLHQRDIFQISTPF